MVAATLSVYGTTRSGQQGGNATLCLFCVGRIAQRCWGANNNKRRVPVGGIGGGGGRVRPRRHSRGRVPQTAAARTALRNDSAYRRVAGAADRPEKAVERQKKERGDVERRTEPARSSACSRRGSPPPSSLSRCRQSRAGCAASCRVSSAHATPAWGKKKQGPLCLLLPPLRQEPSFHLFALELRRLSFNGARARDFFSVSAIDQPLVSPLDAASPPASQRGARTMDRKNVPSNFSNKQNQRVVAPLSLSLPALSTMAPLWASTWPMSLRSDPSLTPSSFCRSPVAVDPAIPVGRSLCSTR